MKGCKRHWFSLNASYKYSILTLFSQPIYTFLSSIVLVTFKLSSNVGGDHDFGGLEPSMLFLSFSTSCSNASIILNSKVNKTNPSYIYRVVGPLISLEKFMQLVKSHHDFRLIRTPTLLTKTNTNQIHKTGLKLARVLQAHSSHSTP